MYHIFLFHLAVLDTLNGNRSEVSTCRGQWFKGLGPSWHFLTNELFFFYYYCLKNLFISKQGENGHAACSVSLMKSQLSILLGAATMPLLERVTSIMYTVFQSKDSTEVSVGGFLPLEIFQYHIWKQEQLLAFTVPVIGLSSSYTLFI